MTRDFLRAAKNPSALARASKICFGARENGNLVVWWASE